MQFDMNIEAGRFQDMIIQGVSREARVAYADQQIFTDIGERLDRAESHYVYEIRDGKLYGEGINEPFDESIERGIIQRWDGSRENSELIGFRFIESFMVDPQTHDGAMVFNPSPPDGGNYKKNYLDVYKKVGNEVHAVRYFSDSTNDQYREKILEINPLYEEVIPESPSDIDFFLNPVVVPKHLDMDPDQLAEFILGSKSGMSEEEYSEILASPNIVALRLSLINTLADNPWVLLELQTTQKALYAGIKKEKDREVIPIFTSQRIQIQYLSQEKNTLGGGGCGSGACSIDRSGYNLNLGPRDEKGPLNFNCPSCGVENTRPYGGYVYKCKNEKCKNPESVLPDFVKLSLS